MATLYSSKELGKGNNRLLMQGLAVMKKHGIAREMNRDSQELQHVVVEGATLKCSEGMRLHTLTIPSGTLETLGGKRVATIYHKELENISFNAFGTCKRKVERYQHTLEGNYKQCDCFVRASQPWESGKANLLPGNQISLSTTSELICDEGGVITIVDDGQHSSEVMTMSSMAVTPTAGMTFLEWLAACAGISQLDTPIPGPADVVAGVLVIGGVIYYGGKAIGNSLAKSSSEGASGSKSKEKAQELPHQGTVEGDVKDAPAVDAGKQGKHVDGHKNNNSNKSQWKKEENGINETQRAWKNGKELPDGTRVWDTGKEVGTKGETGVRVHIDKNGNIHGYPVDPSRYLK